MSWESVWPDLLAKWYGDETLRSSVAEDTIWNLMLLDDADEDVCSDELDLQALAGLLNIVRPHDIGRRFEMDEDPEISMDSFMLAYAQFSGKQMAFAKDWDRPSGSRSDVAINMKGSSFQFERLTQCLQYPKRSPEELEYMDLVKIITLPEMCRIFEETPPRLWEWERVFRVEDPYIRRFGPVPACECRYERMERLIVACLYTYAGSAGSAHVFIV